MRTIQNQGCEIVIFTFGGDGCRGVYEDKYFEIPALPVEVVDTTGAGDVFHGAFDFAYLKGWDAKKCAEFSTGVSAIKCTRPGGRAGIPNLKVLTDFLENGNIDYTEIDERVEHYKRGIQI
jgi:sugar/nucleoside kinase (ribokinase family)